MRSIVFILNKSNKNSIKALAGALEKEGIKSPFVYFASNPEELDRIPGDRLLAFSFTTFHLLWRWKEIRRFIEKKRPGDITIAGGPHPSGDPLGCLSLGFDYVFIGEGEKGFSEMAKVFLEEGSIKPVNGLFSKDLKVTKGERIDLNNYPPISPYYSRLGAIEISRGCRYRCKFCQTSYLFGRDVRERSVDNTLYWVEVLHKSGIRDIRFISPNAFEYGGGPEGIERLLKGVRKIIGKNGRVFFGTFPSEVRPESVSEDILDIISSFCDNKKIGIGAQTGSDRLLEIIGRGHTRDDVLKAVNIAVKKGFQVYVDFIFGLPYENDEDEKETIKLILELVDMGAFIHGHTFMPLPGTPFSRKKPGKLSKKIKKLMGSLSKKGLAFGKWDHQERVFTTPQVPFQPPQALSL